MEFAPDSILLIRFSSLGDIILTTPVIRALKDRYPEAVIDYVTKMEFAEIPACHPGVNHVYAFDSKTGLSGLRGLCREVRSRRYNLIVDLHVNPRSVCLRYFGGAGMMRRYRKRTIQRRLLRQFRINFLQNAGPVLERYFTAIEDFGISHDGKGPELHPDPGAEDKARELLHDFVAEDNRLVLGLGPGASRATKRWPAERFAEASKKISGVMDLCVVLIGSKDEELAARKVRDILTGTGALPVLDLTGKLKVLEAAAVISRLDLLISNDTALMHIACAVKTPVVAVFGPTSRELGFFPFGERSRVVERLDLECRPCSLHGDAFCPEIHFRCMNEITADEVAAAGMELISKIKDQD